MKRLTLIALVLIHSSLFTIHSSDAVAAEQPQHPNIILFLVDDMGWTDCGAYGSQYYETPNVDRLAAGSVRFTQAYAHPLCSPSRASIMTGQEESRHGIMSAHGHLEPEPWGPQVYQENQPFFPPSGPAHRLLQGPPVRSKLLAAPSITRSGGILTGDGLETTI